MITLQLTQKEFDYLEVTFRVNAGTEDDATKATYKLIDQIQAKLDNADSKE